MWRRLCTTARKLVVLVHHTSDMLLTHIRPCCTLLLRLPSATRWLSSFLHQPYCFRLARRGSHSFLCWSLLRKTWAALKLPPVVATHSSTNTLLFAILQLIASRLWGCQLLVAPRGGRNLRSVRGRKTVSFHSADITLFFKGSCRALCISAALGTSRHTSDPASLPPAEIKTLLNTLRKSLSEISGKLVQWALFGSSPQRSNEV